MHLTRYVRKYFWLYCTGKENFASIFYNHADSRTTMTRFEMKTDFSLPL